MTAVGRFALVGLGGFVLQTIVLDALTRLAALDYRAATVLAVEAAILHNFVWHERWTWRARPASGGRWSRVIRFHAANALLSILGNVVLISVFVELLGCPVIVANAVTVTMLAAVNFRATDRWVFGPAPATLLAAGLIVVSSGPAFAGPPDDTTGAWDRYVVMTERRIDGELADGRRFLAMDFEAGRSRADRRRLQNGEVLIEPVATGAGNGGTIDVPGGMIHHWRGYVFIPWAQLSTLMANVSDPTGPRSIRQEDVLESRVLSRSADGLHLFLKLQRHSLVSVGYNTEHDVRYRRYSNTRASSRTVATRIAEIDAVGQQSERERASGEDRGFLWRMNSYWRYEAVPGGVMVELESLTLSRGLPWGTRTVIRPLIQRVAHESMERTLVTLAQRIRGVSEAKTSAPRPAVPHSTAFRNTSRTAGRMFSRSDTSWVILREVS